MPVFVAASDREPNTSETDPVMLLEPVHLPEAHASMPPPDRERTTNLADDRAKLHPAIGYYRVALVIMGIVSLLLTLALAISIRWARHARFATGSRSHPLWGRLFTAQAPTQIVLGDSGLVLFHATARRYVSLHDYVTNDLSKQIPYVQQVNPGFAKFLAGRRYTSFVDAATLVRLLRLPEATPDRTLVHFSRDMHLDDFKNGNVILLGAQEANPWVELFERSMDFVFTIDTPRDHAAFLNRHPLPGEQPLYNPAIPLKSPHVYSVIAFLPNLDANGTVLLLEGISMAGTEAAVDLVMDDQQLLPLLSKIRRADGSLPYFEMLIESDSLNDSAGPPHVVTLHVHPT